MEARKVLQAHTHLETLVSAHIDFKGVEIARFDKLKGYTENMGLLNQLQEANKPEMLPFAEKAFLNSTGTEFSVTAIRKASSNYSNHQWILDIAFTERIVETFSAVKDIEGKPKVAPRMSISFDGSDYRDKVFEAIKPALPYGPVRLIKRGKMDDIEDVDPAERP